MRLMGLINAEAVQNNLWIPKPTLEKANAMFLQVQSVVDVSSSSKRRVSQLQWSSVAKLVFCKSKPSIAMPTDEDTSVSVE